MDMKSLAVVPQPKKKPGPRKRGYIHGHVLLPPDLCEWAKDQEGGLCALVRQLLADERRRREREDASGADLGTS